MIPDLGSLHVFVVCCASAENSGRCSYGVNAQVVKRE